jgi:hypothetical protein
MDIPKINRDHGIFGEYEVTMGARIYENENSATFTSLNQKDFTYYLEEPTYDYGDEEPAEDDLFEKELEDKSYKVDITKYDDKERGYGF